MTRARWALACVVMLGLGLGASHAHAGGRSVLVLRLDGDGDPGVRARLGAVIEKLARATSAQVTVGDTTFAETAVAIGCAPEDKGCAESVRVTLGVDELVHGTATESPTGTTLVVHRDAAHEPPRSATAVLAPQAAPETLESELAPLFGVDMLGPDPSTARSVEEPVPPRRIHRERTKGILIAAGGGLSLVIGLALWSNKSAVQSDIDAAPTGSAEDFARLEELESRAFTYAMVGNLMVLGGLALTGYGGWIIYEDHKAGQLAITPTVTTTSAGVSLGGTW